MVTIRMRILLVCSGILVSWSAIHPVPNFHLKNKSNAPIQVNVMQSGTSETHGVQPIGKDQALPLDLKSNKITTIELYFCPTATWCKTNLPKKLTAQYAPGQTLYIPGPLLDAFLHQKFDRIRDISFGRPDVHRQ